ncbi:hypothetical protein FRC11_004267 [Ceratobasidium sp. 423]|nr:hypothetical protein FRC11_004267 [Ceratobasidium sp. 423]
MATTLSRQTSSPDPNSNYRGAAGSEIPPSPKSPTFSKSLHSRKGSFQISAWLGRGTGQVPQSPSVKSMRISDPQPTNPQDAAARAPGALGKGATVIRTPQHVLTNPFPRSETPNEKDEPFDELPIVDIRAPVSVPPSESTAPLVIDQCESHTPLRESPPIMGQESPAPGRASPAPSGLRSLHSSKSYSQLQSPPRVAPLPLNLASSRQPLLRAALRPPSPTKSTSSNGQFLPLLPPPRQTPVSTKDTSPTTPLPPFHPVLLSAVPIRPVAPSQVIVTLETSTLTQRTTIATLASRPSRLATYLEALVPITGGKEASADPTFSSLFAAHLAQAGIVPQLHSQNGPIHIFLDRPSAPYAHILTYLRSSGSAPSILPRAASLALSAEPTRVEALCELRDEAKFLELTELVELCDKELRTRAPKLRNTASSSSLREYRSGSGSDAGGARTSGTEAADSRLKEYRFGTPAVESLREEEGEGEQAVEVPPIVYEKRGSHAGMVTTVPPRNSQPVNSKVGSRVLRSPPSQPRMRTISEVRYTTQDGRTWL